MKKRSTYHLRRQQVWLTTEGDFFWRWVCSYFSHDRRRELFAACAAHGMTPEIAYERCRYKVEGRRVEYHKA